MFKVNNKRTRNLLRPDLFLGCFESKKKIKKNKEKQNQEKFLEMFTFLFRIICLIYCDKIERWH